MSWTPNTGQLYQLPASGQIDLNAIGVESGQGDTSKTEINDSSVRGLIGKASATQMAMSEWYGASSSDAVDSESFGNSYDIGHLGYVNRDSSRNLDAPLYASGPKEVTVLPQNATTLSWPQSQDGEAHAFTSSHPSWITTTTNLWGDGNKSWSKHHSRYLSKRGANVSFPCPETYSGNRMSANNTTAPTNNKAIYQESSYCTALQRLKPGRYEFEFSISYGKNDDRNYEIWIYLIEKESMQDWGGVPYLSRAVGATKRTQIFHDNSGYMRSQVFKVQANITHEWVFHELYQKSNNYSAVNGSITWVSIKKV